MKRGIPRRPGSWLWLQTPVEAGDIVPLMYRHGLSMKACVARLEGQFPASVVCAAWRRAHADSQARNRTRTLPVVPPAPRPTFPLFVVQEPAMPDRAQPPKDSRGSKNGVSGSRESERRASFADQKASILHLLDLKRAGHSARFTEYNIPSDHGASARIARPLAQVSFTGSSSAMAAGL